MHKLVLTLSLITLVTATSCSSKQQAIGSHKDKHGCYTSAGYTWSQVRQDCIQPWEAGTRLLNAIDSAATTCTYVVMSPDSSRAELFLPSIPTRPILTKSTAGQWQQGSFLLRTEHGMLQLYHKATLIYSQEHK